MISQSLFFGGNISSINIGVYCLLCLMAKMEGGDESNRKTNCKHGYDKTYEKSYTQCGLWLSYTHSFRFHLFYHIFTSEKANVAKVRAECNLCCISWFKWCWISQWQVVEMNVCEDKSQHRSCSTQLTNAQNYTIDCLWHDSKSEKLCWII